MENKRTSRAVVLCLILFTIGLWGTATISARNPVDLPSKADEELARIAVLALNSEVKSTSDLEYRTQIIRKSRFGYVYLAPNKAMLDGEFTVIIETKTGLVLMVARGIIAPPENDAKLKQFDFKRFDSAVESLRRAPLTR